MSSYEPNDQNISMWVQDSGDFSKGLIGEDKSQSYNYSHSHNNDTLLLESSHLPPSNRKPMPNLNHYLPPHGEQPSLLHNLNADSEISLSQLEPVSTMSGAKPAHIGQLISAIKQLSDQIQHLQPNNTRQPSPQQQKDSSSRASEKDIESILTHSSLFCKCEHSAQSSNANTLSQLVNALNTRNQLAIEEQNHSLRRQVSRLEEDNLELRKLLRKVDAQNTKNKELLKQYQQLNKRQGLMFKDRVQPSNNIRQALSGEQRVRQRQSPSFYAVSRANYKSLDPQEIIKQQLETRIALEERMMVAKAVPETPCMLGSRQSPLNFQKTQSKQSAQHRRVFADQQAMLRATCGVASTRNHHNHTKTAFRQLFIHENHQLGSSGTVSRCQTMSSLPQAHPLKDRTSGLNLRQQRDRSVSRMKGSAWRRNQR